MAGFQNSQASLSGTGFVNTTNDLTVTTSASTVPIEITGSLPAGSYHIGQVSLDASLPTGTNHIGEISIATGQSIALVGGTLVGLTGELPAGTQEIGIVALKNGTLVGLAPGAQVQLASGGNTIGNVGINGTVSVSGTVAVSSLPSVTLASGSNTIGDVGFTMPLLEGTNHIGEVSLAAGTTVEVTGATFSDVVLGAGSAAIGSVSINAALPAGSNTIGNVTLNTSAQHIGQVSLDAALPAGVNSIGSVKLDAGTNNVGKVTLQGVDHNGVTRTIAVDGYGAQVPSTAQPVHTIVEILAGTNTELLGANPDRLLYSVQLMGVYDVLISEEGSTLTSLNDPGVLIIAGGAAGTIYQPPFSSTLAINGYAAQTTRVRVTEYIKV